MEWWSGREGAPKECDRRWPLPVPYSCVLKDRWKLDQWMYWERWREQERILYAYWWHRGGSSGVPLEWVVQFGWSITVILCFVFCLSPSLHLSSWHCQELGPEVSTQSILVLGCPYQCREVDPDPLLHEFTCYPTGMLGLRRMRAW